MKTDDVDLKIVSLLRDNSRMPNVEIAREIGLTEGAVRHRIETLLTRGMIKKFTIEQGSDARVFAVVMLKAKAETKKMMAEVAALGTAKDAYEVSGEYDGCVIMEGNDLREVDAKIDGLRKLKTVADTKTFVSFRKW